MIFENNKNIQKINFNILDYLSVRETSKIIGKSIPTIYAYIYAKIIPTEKFANVTWLIPKTWIEEYLAGKITIKGAYKGYYAKYRKKIRKRNRKKSS